MGMERTRRAVLVGTDTTRLLALADELEARGLEVALYREAERGLATCESGECDVLVAIGRLASRDGVPMQRVAVPLVLLDAPDAPDLPLRPIGPRTALGASVAPAAAADRVLALVARAPDAQAAAVPAPPAPAPEPRAAQPPPVATTPSPAAMPLPQQVVQQAAPAPPVPPHPSVEPAASTAPPETRRTQPIPAKDSDTANPPSLSPHYWGAGGAPPERPAPAVPEPAAAAPRAEPAAADRPSGEEPPAERPEPAVAAPGPAEHVSSVRRTIADAEDAPPAAVEPAGAGPAARSRRGWLSPPNLLLILAGLALGLALGFVALGLNPRLGMP